MISLNLNIRTCFYMKNVILIFSAVFFFFFFFFAMTQLFGPVFLENKTKQTKKKTAEKSQNDILHVKTSGM